MMSRMIVFICLLGILAGALSAETLEQFLSDKIITDYQLDPEYVKVTVVRSGLEHTDLDGLDIEAYAVSQAAPRGRFPMRVELSRNGSIIEKGAVSLDIRISADLPVPAQNIKRHELLTADKFTLKRIDLTSLTEPMLTDLSQCEGCRAKHNLAADRCVPLNRVERLPDVENGHTVTIVGIGGYFEIRARGVALQNGVIGENIKIKNIDSRKILVGKVTGPGVVEIAI